MHHFDWEVSLVIPTASGHRVVSSSVGRSHGCSHVWSQPELFRLFQQTLFQQRDPLTRDVIHLLYTLVCTPPHERLC